MRSATRPRPPFAFVLAIALFAADQDRAQEVAASRVPDTSLLTITIRDGDEQLLALRRTLNDRGFWETAAGQSIQANPGIAAARLMIGGLAAAGKVDTWTLFAHLLGRETIIAFVPAGEGDPKLVLSATARDARQLDAMLDPIHAAAGLTINGKPNDARSTIVDGVVVFAVSEQLFHARVGDGIVMSNDREAIRAALAAASGKQPRLADSHAYQSSVKAVAPNAFASIHASLGALRAAPNLREMFAEKASNPLAGFLFGGWSQVLRSADDATVSVSAGDGTLALDLAVARRAAVGDAHTAFANADAPVSGWRADALPGYLAEIRVQRDWAGLFADREALLTLPAASDAANFATVMSTLLGQIDFLDDFLTRITGPARLVLANQDFEGKPWQPTPVLPGFALIAPMDFETDPAFAEDVNSAAMNTLAIAGLDQAQKQQPSLRTKMGAHAGITYVYGEYPRPRNSPDQAEGADDSMMASPAAIQYNFTPGVAIVGGELVIATSRDLLEDVIDARLAAREPRHVDRDEMSIHAPALEAILRENLEELVVNRMLEQNASRADAEAYLESIFAGIRSFQSLNMTSSVTEAGLVLRLSLTLAETH